MSEPFRLPERLPITAVKTYGIVVPPDTHFRDATCAEAGCLHHAEGWRSRIDEATDLGKAQAWWIRNQSGRRFTEDRNAEPGLTVFTFEAGQTCFHRLGEVPDPARPHRMRVDRPELFIVRGGDHRGNPTGDVRRHASAEDWRDDFGEHQERLADQIEKG